MMEPLTDKTLFEAIDAAVQLNPLRVAVVLMEDDGSRQTITSGELHHGAIRRARALRERGFAPNDLVLLALPHSRALIETFLGAAYGAALPAILLYPPDRIDSSSYIGRVHRLAMDSGARAVICPAALSAGLRAAIEGADCQIIDAEALTYDAPSAVTSTGHADQTAFVQFTSGTTGIQKGVPVSQGAVLSFLNCLRVAAQPTARDVVVSWLPLYHDMGLITGVLFPLISNLTTVLMSPANWVRRPVLMLQAVHEFNGTMSWMPNFAFSHCARSVRETDLETLKLDSWRFLVNGAEPVRHDSMDAFCRRFAPCGLRPSVLRAGYGMAENVLTATMTARYPRVDWIRVADLQQSQAAVPAEPSAAGSMAVVSNGPPLAGTEIAIVDATGQVLPERQVGEILVRSPHLFRGYHRRPDLAATVLRNGWFCSGDLGYLANGELHICGRMKDVIIVGGNNVYPEDVEAIADRVPGVQPGRAVAFGVNDEQLGTERLVVVCELREPVPADGPRAVERPLRRRVLEELDVTVSDVLFVSRGWVIKTTSGKLARAANREKYLAHRKANNDAC